jgi:hypothetical protein
VELGAEPQWQNTADAVAERNRRRLSVHSAYEAQQTDSTQEERGLEESKAAKPPIAADEGAGEPPGGGGVR